MTKEGLYVDLDLTLPYRIDSTKVDDIRNGIGVDGKIEEKKTAEQEALRMEYILQQERLEKERKIIAGSLRDIGGFISEVFLLLHKYNSLK